MNYCETCGICAYIFFANVKKYTLLEGWSIDFNLTPKLKFKKYLPFYHQYKQWKSFKQNQTKNNSKNRFWHQIPIPSKVLIIPIRINRPNPYVSAIIPSKKGLTLNLKHWKEKNLFICKIIRSPEKFCHQQWRRLVRKLKY